MKKEIALVIPLSILADKELNAKDKLLYGLHYAYYKKSGETYLTNVEIAALLKLHKNRVGDGNTALIDRGLLEEVKSNFRIVESSIDKTEDYVLLPFELYHLELTPNLKLLWAEYNRFGRGEDGYYVLRVNTANNLGIKESTVSSLTTKLELLNMIECRREFGRKVNKRTIFTKDLTKVEIVIKPTKPKPKKEESIKPLEAEKVKTNSVDKERIEYLKGLRKKSKAIESPIKSGVKLLKDHKKAEKKRFEQLTLSEEELKAKKAKKKQKKKELKREKKEWELEEKRREEQKRLLIEKGEYNDLFD